MRTYIIGETKNLLGAVSITLPLMLTELNVPDKPIEKTSVPIQTGGREPVIKFHHVPSIQVCTYLPKGLQNLILGILYFKQQKNLLSKTFIILKVITLVPTMLEQFNHTQNLYK